MKIQRAFSIFYLTVYFLLQSTQAHAAVDAAVAQGIATAFAGKTVSNIVNDVRLSGVGLIDQATQSGNALISRAGNETNVLAGNLDIIFKEDMNLTFDRLSEERKAVLIEAEAMRRSLAAVKDSAYSFKDSVALDLNSLVTSLPFVKEKFFVQSIRGLSYLPQAGDFKLQLSATTLGIQEGVATTIEVFKGHGTDKKPITDIVSDQSKQRFFAELQIPNKQLASDFKDSQLTILPLTIRFNISRKKGWWIFSRQDQQVYDVPVYISLFPKTAGTLVSITKQPVYSWVGAGIKSDRYNTPNRHCDDKCGGERTRGGNRIEFAVAGGSAPYKVGYKRLLNARQSCVGGNCGYSDSFKVGLTDNETRLIFTWDTWSTSGTWEATADIVEYQVTGESSKTSAAMSANFGRILEILIPKDSTFGVLKVRTFTKQEYEIQIGQADPYGILTYQGKSDAGPEFSRATFRVNDPLVVAASNF